jgi:hypothetical protein
MVRRMREIGSPPVSRLRGQRGARGFAPLARTSDVQALAETALIERRLEALEPSLGVVGDEKGELAWQGWSSSSMVTTSCFGRAPYFRSLRGLLHQAGRKTRLARGDLVPR